VTIPPTDRVRYRPGGEADLDACTALWKAGIDDYQARLNQPAAADDLRPLRRLLEHLVTTDRGRFWIADHPAAPGSGPIGFASATVRGDLWFLAMLFVDPSSQRNGVGAALMDRAQVGRGAPGAVVPGPDDPLGTGIRRWGMCTDSAQPVSNALYARRGMVPRLPIWRLSGEVRRPWALPDLPATLELVEFEALAADGPDGHRRLADLVNAVDREVIGLEHGQDHAFLRRDGRSGFLVRERGGRPIGYAYGSGVGRLGPVAALDPALIPALIGAAIREIPAGGPVAIWVPGTTTVAFRALLDAGLRLEGFPGLVCWAGAEHPFERYLPISLALV
jgi:GNAT superfamily N-acetyltransferase